MKAKTKRIGGVAAVTAVAGLIAGCPAVPDIYFVSDASVDGGGQPRDGGPPLEDVFAPDGAEGGGGGCQAPQPSNTICCGNNWCFDCPLPQHCTSCAQAGCGSQICCGKGGGNVVCKPGCP